MNNGQIIEMAKANAGIVEEIHTFKGWKNRGYSVKKGEKTILKVTIWKKPESKDKETGETIEGEGFFMKTAHFFGAHQVEISDK